MSFLPKKKREELISKRESKLKNPSLDSVKPKLKTECENNLKQLKELFPEIDEKALLGLVVNNPKKSINDHVETIVTKKMYNQEI